MRSTGLVIESANPALINFVPASIANLYVATPFAAASYPLDLANVYLGSPVALLANGLQVADVFIGSPAAGEFSGLNGYNVSVGTLRLARRASHAVPCTRCQPLKVRGLGPGRGQPARSDESYCASPLSVCCCHRCPASSGSPAYYSLAGYDPAPGMQMSI